MAVSGRVPLLALIHALGRPGLARADPTPRTTPIKSGSSRTQRLVLHGAVFLGDPLSGSRPPRLGRPCGPSHAIGFAEPRLDAQSQGIGACEKDGDDQAVAGASEVGVMRSNMVRVP